MPYPNLFMWCETETPNIPMCCIDPKNLDRHTTAKIVGRSSSLIRDCTVYIQPHFWDTSLLTVNFLKFCTPKFKQNGMYKQCRPRSDCSWRSSLIRVYTVCHFMKYRNNCLEKQNLGQKVWSKVFEILGHLLYSPSLLKFRRPYLP